MPSPTRLAGVAAVATPAKAKLPSSEAISVSIRTRSYVSFRPRRLSLFGGRRHHLRARTCSLYLDHGDGGRVAPSLLGRGAQVGERGVRRTAGVEAQRGCIVCIETL